tara:strand:- start:23 stop:241 length:219 start_codon:yes stop_codon:yes gene_type:complete
MLSKNMLLGLLKPLLPKLEGFLQNQKLEDGEEAKILLDVKNKEISITIIAIKEIDGQVVITRVLSGVDPKEL